MIRADERLQRLLMAFPLMADEPRLTVDEIAQRVGTNVKVLTKDFASLERYDTPAGWVDTVQVFIQQGHASMVSSHFKRPQKLNRPEMLALDLGLGMLQRELPVDEQPIIAQTRQTLQALSVRRAASGAEGVRRELTTVVEGAREPELASLAVLHAALEQKHVVALEYQRPNELQAGVRRVRPYALVRAEASDIWWPGASGLRRYVYSGSIVCCAPRLPAIHTKYRPTSHWHRCLSRGECSRATTASTTRWWCAIPRTWPGGLPNARGTPWSRASRSMCRIRWPTRRGRFDTCCNTGQRQRSCHQTWCVSGYWPCSTRSLRSSGANAGGCRPPAGSVVVFFAGNENPAEHGGHDAHQQGAKHGGAKAVHERTGC